MLNDICDLLVLGIKLVKVASLLSAAVVEIGWDADNVHGGLAEEVKRRVEQEAQDLEHDLPQTQALVQALDPDLKQNRLLRYDRLFVSAEGQVVEFILRFCLLAFEVLAPSVPEQFGLLALNELIKRVFDVGLPEVRQGASNHYKQNHSHRKHVD